MTSALIRNSALAILTIFALALFAPLATYGQDYNADLRMTVREAILSDPRTSTMTEAEIDAMVEALATEAEAQGVTSEDIMWQPVEEAPEPAPVVAPCGSMPVFFCTLNEAFGLDGSDVAIPIGLGITAAVLLFVIGMMLLHRHGHHPVAGEVGIPNSFGSRSSDKTPPTPPTPPTLPTASGPGAI